MHSCWLLYWILPNINLIINRNIKRPRRRQIKTLNLNPVCIFVGMMMRKTKKRTHHAIANIAEKNRDDGFSCKRSLKFQSSIEMRAKSRSSNLWEHLIIIGGHFPTKQVSEWVSKYKTKGDGKSSQSAKIVRRVFVIMTVDLAKDYDQNCILLSFVKVVLNTKISTALHPK